MKSNTQKHTFLSDSKDFFFLSTSICLKSFIVHLEKPFENLAPWQK